MYLSPGFANELLHIYHAVNIEKVEQPLAQDEDEVLELYALTLAEAKQAMSDQVICDAKTIYAIQYWGINEQRKVEGSIDGQRTASHTRSEIRKRQQEQAQESLKNKEKRKLRTNKKKKKIASFYRKEQKKNKPITKTRAGEREKHVNGMLF